MKHNTIFFLCSLSALFFVFLSVVQAADPIPPADAADLVEVNWFQELLEGGVTILVQGALSIALVALAIERWLTLRPSRFVPPGLKQQVKPLFHQGQYDQIIAHARRKPSVFSDVIIHFVRFRNADHTLLGTGAGDIGARAIVDQEQKCVPLAAIAAIAPLLGLLGTMIGMIEAFKLVEVFGDEGGASLLAGSISKALITTAVGLVLAIPALMVYYWAKHRVHVTGNVLEKETEELFNDWFLALYNQPQNPEQP